MTLNRGSLIYDLRCCKPSRREEQFVKLAGSEVAVNKLRSWHRATKSSPIVSGLTTRNNPFHHKKMKKSVMTAYAVVCLLALLTTTDGAKIVFISQIFVKSHHKAFASLVDGLAERKHEVTFLTYFPHGNRDVTMMYLKAPEEVMGDPKVMIDFMLNASKRGPVAQFMKYAWFAESVCDGLLKDEATKKLLAAGKQFDVAVVDVLFGDCPVAMASLLAKNIIYYYTSNWLAPWMNYAVPTPYSYVPNSLERLPTKMNFWQRLQNTITMISVGFVHKYYVNAAQQRVLDKLLPEAPKISEVHKIVDFSLINGDSVTVSPRPMMPNIINTGAMHCREAKPLPKDLSDFVEDSGKDGFILFSLGSMVMPEFMSPEFLNAVNKTFSQLKQRVIWKFGRDLENLPPNVKIIPWVPQQDLLGHPKARLFITHSGLLSLQETIYHAVPVIGMSFFADQPGNAARIKELGIGKILDFEDITFESFYQAVNQILNDKRYYSNMKKYSAILRDQLHRPVDTAVYWVEYVIRHAGALHLKSAGEDLNFFQYFLLDVAAFVVFVAAIVVGITTYSLTSLLCKLFARKAPSGQSDKKMQ